MDIKNGYGILSAEERKATGLPSPVEVTAINPAGLLGALHDRKDRLYALQSADDDELTHAERAQIPGLNYELLQDEPHIINVASTVLPYLVERELGR